MLPRTEKSHQTQREQARAAAFPVQASDRDSQKSPSQVKAVDAARRWLSARMRPIAEVNLDKVNLRPGSR